MICVPFSAFGAELSYAENGSELSRFFDDKAVYAPGQIIESPNATYIGRYGYYLDLENGFFYLHISYREDSLANGENVVFINFNIKNSSREYQFNVDENGFLNSSDNIEKSFDVIAEFGDASPQGQELYIGVKFLNKSDKVLNTLIGFSIFVNGSTYNLCDGIELEFDALTTTKQSTTKKETTTKKDSQAEKTTEKKESTTKFKYNGAGATTSEKFTYNGGGYDESLSDYDENYMEYYAGESVAPNGAAVLDQGNSSSLSTTAKLLYAAAIVLAASGTVIILYNALRYKEEQKENQKENSKD